MEKQTVSEKVKINKKQKNKPLSEFKLLLKQFKHLRRFEFKKLKNEFWLPENERLIMNSLSSLDKRR